MTKDNLKMTLGTQAKVETAKGAATAGIIAQLTELAAVGVAGWLLSVGSLDQDNFMIVVGACVIGPAVAHIRGKVPTSSIVTLGALLPLAVQKNLFG